MNLLFWGVALIKCLFIAIKLTPPFNLLVPVGLIIYVFFFPKIVRTQCKLPQSGTRWSPRKSARVLERQHWDKCEQLKWPERSPFVKQGGSHRGGPRATRAQRQRGRRHQEGKHRPAHFEFGGPTGGRRASCQVRCQCGLPIPKWIHSTLHVSGPLTEKSVNPLLKQLKGWGVSFKNYSFQW